MTASPTLHRRPVAAILLSIRDNTHHVIAHVAKAQQHTYSAIVVNQELDHATEYGRLILTDIADLLARLSFTQYIPIFIACVGLCGFMAGLTVRRAWGKTV